jgi:basic membrane protein A and related proteins
VRTTTKTRIAAGAAVVALAAAGCGSKSTAKTNPGGTNNTASSTGAPSTTSTSSAAAASFNACMVTDIGGIDDKSFNASAWAGMQAAQKDGKANVQYVQSTNENDYVPNINGLVAKKCDLIVTVGGLMGDATDQAAEANTSQKFAIVDDGPMNFKTNKVEPNVHGLQFNTAQGAFLAGYLAAGSTKTGKVATWGGLNIPPVTVYMDGFFEGVQYYNQKKGTKVQVLGWDEANQKGGTFSQSFTDSNVGKSTSDNFVNQGADIIFPVAGGAGAGAAKTAAASHGAVSVIWVDTDGCTSDAADCGVFLASVTKGISGAVQKVVEDTAGGTYQGGKSDILDLSNGGTDLVLGSQLGPKVPSTLTDEIKQVKADIVGGKIQITSPSQPK